MKDNCAGISASDGLISMIEAWGIDNDTSADGFSNAIDDILTSIIGDMVIKIGNKFLAYTIKLNEACFITKWYYKMQYDKYFNKLKTLDECLNEIEKL